MAVSTLTSLRNARWVAGLTALLTASGLDYRVRPSGTDGRYGMAADAVEGTAGVMSSATNPTRITDAGNPFAKVVPGMAIAVEGAGASSGRLITTVASVD